MTEFEKKLWKLLCVTETGGGGGQSGEEYGIEWDYSNPSPVLTRTGDAASFANPVPATSLAGTGSSPFDNIMPWAGMRMCNIINGEVVYWQGDPQFSETAYDTMVFIPEFWYKAEKDTENHKWRWSISPTEKDGYDRHPGSGRYIARFSSSGSSSGVYSKSGVKPLVQTNRPDYRAYCHRKGAKWWMLDLATWSAVQLLYLVEFADFDAQTILGGGVDNKTQYTDIIATGMTRGAVYHTIKRSGNSNQYRWIEDLYSNVRNWLDGFVTSDLKAYVGTDNASFSDDTSSMIDSGITLPESGYISGFGYSSVCPWAFIPDETAGSEPTHVQDYIQTKSGTFAISVGGGVVGKPLYGLFCSNTDYLASKPYAHTSTRLIFIP